MISLDASIQHTESVNQGSHMMFISHPASLPAVGHFFILQCQSLG